MFGTLGVCTWKPLAASPCTGVVHLGSSACCLHFIPCAEAASRCCELGNSWELEASPRAAKGPGRVEAVHGLNMKAGVQGANSHDSGGGV